MQAGHPRPLPGWRRGWREMKTERECEDEAVRVLTEYVNGCQPNSREDCLRAINKLIAVAMNAQVKVAAGKMEYVQ